MRRHRNGMEKIAERMKGDAKMATLRQFAEQIAGEVKGYFPKEFQDIGCKVEENLKNNSVCRVGIRFWKPGERVSPTIYMESYYDSHKSGKTMDEIMKDIASNLQRVYELGKKFPADKLDEYEQMKGLVEPVLVNVKANRERLQHSPHIIIEDLAVAFQVACHVETGKMCTPVKDEHLEEWGIGKEQLYEQAFKNVQESGEYTLYGLNDCIEGALKGQQPEEDFLMAPECFVSDNQEMYVLSNKDVSCGAVAIACPDVMEKVCRLFPDGFYILPSSIHECMILGKGKGLGVKELEKMVREINHTQVEPEERLSDHVYEYDRERGSIRLAAKERNKERGMER